MKDGMKLEYPETMRFGKYPVLKPQNSSTTETR